jgi:hypothetical protein
MRNLKNQRKFRMEYLLFSSFAIKISFFLSEDADNIEKSYQFFNYFLLSLGEN